MELLQEYLVKFESKDGSRYGLRLGVPSDAESFSKAFIEVR